MESQLDIIQPIYLLTQQTMEELQMDIIPEEKHPTIEEIEIQEYAQEKGIDYEKAKEELENKTVQILHEPEE